MTPTIVFDACSHVCWPLAVRDDRDERRGVFGKKSYCMVLVITKLFVLNSLVVSCCLAVLNCVVAQNSEASIA